MRGIIKFVLITDKRVVQIPRFWYFWYPFYGMRIRSGFVEDFSQERLFGCLDVVALDFFS